ncbi:hypothetical protein ACE1OA_04455 [Streptomyces sp. JL2001]
MAWILVWTNRVVKSWPVPATAARARPALRPAPDVSRSGAWWGTVE